MSDNPSTEESQVKLFGFDVSVRGAIAFLCIFTLCVVTFIKPEDFASAFKDTVQAVVFFYLGQNNKR